MAPGDLEKALCGLDIYRAQNVLVGFEGAEDAGVYQLSDELAVVTTVDFFTPIVDDPYRYGQIAAANSLSDIYAMGATPVCALNIVAFPSRNTDLAILRDILRGGADKLREAKVSLLGGHSVEDAEIKYGLAVVGAVHPERLIRNSEAVVGDRLLLTKPLGTGIINTALKKGLVSPGAAAAVEQTMATLNRDAAAIMKNYPVHACTDVTGFGLLGHLAELIENSGVGACLNLEAIPTFPETLRLAAKAVPGGARHNRQFRESMVKLEPGIGEEYVNILYDPQTSGGLLIAVAAEAATALLTALHSGGVNAAAIIGEITAAGGEIIVRRH